MMRCTPILGEKSSEASPSRNLVFTFVVKIRMLRGLAPRGAQLWVYSVAFRPKIRIVLLFGLKATCIWILRKGGTLNLVVVLPGARAQVIGLHIAQRVAVGISIETLPRAVTREVPGAGFIAHVDREHIE